MVKVTITLVFEDDFSMDDFQRNKNIIFDVFYNLNTITINDVQYSGWTLKTERPSE